LLALIVQGLSLGLAAGMSPGPLQTYAINSALRFGWRRAIWIAFAPLASDAIIVPLILLFLSAVPEAWLNVLKLAGGLYTLWLAYGAWRSIQAGATIAASEADVPPPLTMIRRALFINMLSPGVYIFWITINGPLLREGWAQSPLVALAFLLAFYSVLIGLVAAFVLVFDRLGRLDARLTRAILLLTVLILVVLGASFIVQGVSGFAALAA